MPLFSTLPVRLTTLALVVMSAALAAAGLQAQDATPSPFADISFRAIGPTAQGGRYVDYAVVEATPQVFYAATGSGGLWKTENHGLTWESIFDTQPVVSIGAVALFQPNPAIVWVGTGEANNSRSTYWGDGIYKSTDAGKTWTNVGLRDSHHIGRIVTHPTDPNTVYAAVLGHLYSYNEERGLYKTIDGGKTWRRVLDVTSEGKKVGVVDVAMDPKNANVLFAASYDKVREPWTFVEGGPGSALYRSDNAGRTWTKLAGGLPAGMLGRIGVAISRQDPKTVYATIENVNAKGVSDEERRQQLLVGKETPDARSIGNEVYKSVDGGRTWTNVSAPGVGEGPPYYYGQVRVDPNDTNHVYVLGVGVHHTTDGGKTWTRPFPFGGDNHALWINPRDSRHMILGHDHSMGVTFDAGQSWYRPDNKPLAQFYAIGVDMDEPYNVYGGTQDNGSWRGPSSKPNGAPIRIEDWFNVGGGDGMYNVPDWSNSRWLYNESQFGPLVRVDQQTGARKSIRYRGPGASEMRWNWNSPIVVSPHDSDVIYHAGNRVLRSAFRGENWEFVSPDLTVNEEKKRDGRGNIQYATITALDESPIVPGLLWAGTDDGNVQVTRDGGATWTNVRGNMPGHPGYWVSRVEPSNHNPAVAYVSVTGYRNDDFTPFVWKTSDYGQTWTSIAGNLPDEPINVIREDHRNPNLLIVGTELGLHASLDGGRSWGSIRGDMPRQPTHDAIIHPRADELVVGTHGRGMFITDLSPLQALTADTMNAPAHLIDPRPAMLSAGPGLRRASATQNFNGPSRPAGATLHYWLSAPAAGEVTVRIYDGTRLVYELKGPNEAGVNTVVWDLTRFTRERTDAEKQAARAAGARRGRFGGPPPHPEFITGPGMPGTYRVVLSAGGRTIEKPLLVTSDPGAR